MTAPSTLAAPGLAAAAPNESNRIAQQDTTLAPRFYTTDFAAIDRLDVSGIREQWDALMKEFGDDNNTDHFQRPADLMANYSGMPPALYKEFSEFLISSITSEFSGCVLYAEIKKRVQNPDMKELFGFMARDESRHAGFINLAMHKLVVNQAMLTMGLEQTQMFATIFDGITRHNPEGLWFRRYAQVEGHKAAVLWRDSGRPIPEGDDARARIAELEAQLRERDRGAS